MNQLRIVFMGTPEFAVGILDTIIKNNYNVVGVITAADKPAGRGQKIKYSAVKEYALANNLTLLQPTNLKDEGFLTELKALDANLQIVVAFRMLPEVVWKMPKLGTFNLHASLLPNYRGAAPINWAGTVLSQPPINTTASIGWARIISSVSMAIRLRKYILVGCAKLS